MKPREDHQANKPHELVALMTYADGAITSICRCQWESDECSDADEARKAFDDHVVSVFMLHHEDCKSVLAFTASALASAVGKLEGARAAGVNLGDLPEYYFRALDQVHLHFDKLRKAEGEEVPKRSIRR